MKTATDKSRDGDTNQTVSDSSLRAIHHALLVLSKHLPEINIMFEENFDRVSEQLIDLSTRLDAYHALSKPVKGEEAIHEQRATLYNELRQTLSQSITDMQFQDRISQNIGVTINIANVITKMLEAQIACEGGLDDKLTKEMLDQMTLGEIKRKFLDYAESTGGMQDTANMPL